MDQNTLKITNVLSDPTRFSIYQFISKQRGDVTVQEIADQFSIHPNVARLHLTKLEDVQMIDSTTKKTGKGGRPSRFYRLSGEVIQLQFPFRDYQRLANIALQSLADFGEAGREALEKIGFKYGRESAEAYVQQFHVDHQRLTRAEKVKIIEQIAVNQGLDPEVRFDEKRNEIHLSIYNCTFKELMSEHSLSLCSMHHQLFNGIFSFFFGEHTVKENSKMTDPDTQACLYSVIALTDES